MSPMGVGMCGPVLIGHGSAAQQDDFLPRMLNGEHWWCQGYSEPGSGSDLASLQMSRSGRRRRLHRQWPQAGARPTPMWPTGSSAWSAPAGKSIQQQGITFILIDMANARGRGEADHHAQRRAHPERTSSSPTSGFRGPMWWQGRRRPDRRQIPDAVRAGRGVSSPGSSARLEKIRAMAQAEGLVSDRSFMARLAQAQIRGRDPRGGRTAGHVQAQPGRGARGAESSLLEDGGAQNRSQRPTRTGGRGGGRLCGALPAPPDLCRQARPPGSSCPTTGSRAGRTRLARRPPSISMTGPVRSMPGRMQIQRNIMAKAVLGI